MRIPTDREIRALHERHAPTGEALDEVHAHCEIVCRIATQLLGRGFPGADAVDAGLVRAGCLLHDIGVYRLYDEAGRLDHAGYIRHGVLGHDLLAAEGLAEGICRFASCHTGVGISRQDSPPRFLSPGEYAASVRRFGEDKVARFEAMRARFGDPDLTRLGWPQGIRGGGSAARISPAS